MKTFSPMAGRPRLCLGLALTIMVACETATDPVATILEIPEDLVPVGADEVVGRNIRDEANGGVPGFLLLAPLTTDTVGHAALQTGRAERLSVDVCRLDNGSCAGDPVFEAVSTPDDSSLLEQDSFYESIWHTGTGSPDPGAYRIRVFGDGALLGSADVSLVEKGVGVTIGRPLPIRFTVEHIALPEFVVSVTGVDSLKPLLFGLDVSVNPEADVTVDYVTLDGPRLRVSRQSGDSSHVILGRLLADRFYDYEVRVSRNGVPVAPPLVGSFKTDTLPTDLNAVVLTASGLLSVPMVMLELRVPTFQGFVAIDGTGRPVWYHRTSGSSWGWTRRANGNFVFLDTGDGLNEVTPLGATVASLFRANGEVIHHDVVATENNTLLFMTRHPQDVDSVTWVGEIIWEWDPDTGDLDERWNSFDYLSPAVDIGPRSRTGDWLHTNALTIGPGGRMLMSSPFLDQIIAIPADFNGIDWRLGGVNATIATDSASTFAFQHSAYEVETNRVLMFDNRGPGTHSRAIEVVIDPTTDSASLDWEFVAPNMNYAPIISSARRLPNGNRLVTFGTSDGFRGSIEGIEVYEVDDAGVAVWSLTVSGPMHMYRAAPVHHIANEVQVGN